ncbi:MAG: hypothetical protein WAN60_14185 [Candidatus Sulfotelmatobacter sp.]
MKAFHSGREAKEFLISQIVEEAQQENIPLSEVERKMLYFTESGWTLPDIMTVNEDFDREYDEGEYEHKIAKLVAKADKRIRKGARDDYDKWWAAIRFLEREDHYILVMIRSAGLRPRGDQLRLLAAGLGIVTVMLIAILLSVKYDIHMPYQSDLGTVVWVFLACLFVSYMLLRFIIGARKADDLTSTVLKKLSRIWQRVSGNA